MKDKKKKNRLAKEKGEAYLVGDDKKLAVVSRLSEWVSISRVKQRRQ